MGDLSTSTFLFARPSASEGAARILDFANTLFAYNVSASEREADDIALRMDYQAVANDLNNAIRERACGKRQQGSP